jgi:hypothetical protein
MNGTGADREPLYCTAGERRLSMVAVKKNVVTIHRTTFAADPSSKLKPHESIFDMIRRFMRDMPRRLVGSTKAQTDRMQEAKHVVRRLEDYRRARTVVQKR